MATPSSALASAAVLLVGTGRHDDHSELPDVPAVGTTLEDLEHAFVLRGGVADGAVQVVLDPATPTAFGDALATTVEHATGLAVFYYVGHGLVAPDGTLYLATQTTRHSATRLHHTALPYPTVRQYLLEYLACGRTRSAVVILDCCFSGRAVANLSGTLTAGSTDIKGGYVLTSAGRDELALAPDGARHTTFSGALLRLLADGDPDGPAQFTLDEVFRHLDRSLSAGGYPRPRCSSTGRVGEILVAPNPAYRAAARPPASPAPVTPEQAPPPADPGVDWLDEARRGLERHDFSTARYAALEARRASGTSAEPWSLLARANAGLDRTEDAVVEATRAVTLAPDDIEHHLLLGNVYEQSEQWDNARRAYEEAGRLAPGDERPPLALATLLARSAGPHGALPALEHLFTTSRDRGAAGLRLGQTLVHAADTIPTLHGPCWYTVTSREEIRRMRPLLHRAWQVTDNPQVRRDAEQKIGYLNWCATRHFCWRKRTDVLRDSFANPRQLGLGCLKGILIYVAVFTLAIPVAQVPSLLAVYWTLVSLVRITGVVLANRPPGWKINRYPEKRRTVAPTHPRP